MEPTLIMHLLDDYPKSQQLKALELILNPSKPQLEELCAVSTWSGVAKNIPLPLFYIIENMRELIAVADKKDATSIELYLSTQLEVLAKKITPEEVPSINNKSLVSFLACASGYLFQKISDNFCAAVDFIQAGTNNALEARVQPNIK